MGSTVSILLARGGSKGVPGKNLRHVGGLSLTARSVIAARAVKSLAAAYVSTDDPSIAEEARRFGARVVDRPPELSGDTASSESGWLHALETVKRDFPDVARLVLLQCTSPFTTGDDIEACLNAMEAAGANCALAVVSDHSFLWGLDENGRGRGVNHDETQQRSRRQDLPPSFRESGAIYCVRVSDFEKVGRRFCGTVALHPVDHPPVEIDTEADLNLCDMIARQAKHAATQPDLSKVKAVVMDFDGVHTNDKVIVDETGDESVIVSRKDGMGIEILRESGRYRLLILSKERNPVVQRRAEKLRVDCLPARDDKVAALSAWLDEAGLSWEETLFIGNDVNDAGPLERAGVAACPCDAHPAVLPLADWIVPVKGGDGVLRAVSDALLAAPTTSAK
jgi:YrbI family 3-deoxy-D-manno-octulosonate 8-phosphate phosphatase